MRKNVPFRPSSIIEYGTRYPTCHVDRAGEGNLAYSVKRQGFKGMPCLIRERKDVT